MESCWKDLPNEFIIRILHLHYMHHIKPVRDYFKQTVVPVLNYNDLCYSRNYGALCQSKQTDKWSYLRNYALLKVIYDEEDPDCYAAISWEKRYQDERKFRSQRDKYMIRCNGCYLSGFYVPDYIPIWQDVKKIKKPGKKTLEKYGLVKGIDGKYRVHPGLSKTFV